MLKMRDLGEEKPKPLLPSEIRFPLRKPNLRILLACNRDSENTVFSISHNGLAKRAGKSWNPEKKTLAI